MDELQNLLERPIRYYNVDGMGELSIGFMSLGWVLLGWLQLRAPAGSAWHQMPAFCLYVAVMLAIVHFGPKAIKSRITYPRTGFVEYRARGQRWISLGVAAAVSAVISAGLVMAMRKEWDVSIAPSVMGLLLAASYIRIARAVPWKWIVFGGLVMGTLVIAFLPRDLVEGFASHTSPTTAIPPRTIGTFWLTVAIYGVALMTSGGISFWLYLRHTQPPRDAE